MPPRPPHHRHVPSSEISGFIDAAKIERLLQPWVPQQEARAFVTRCLLGEGPAHHRGANYVLLMLLGEALERAPAPGASGAAAHQGGETLEVPMRLPPHLSKGKEAKSFPLGLPVRAIERLAPRESREFDAMVDCLTDGPPQHALANVVLVDLVSAALAAVERRRG